MKKDSITRRWIVNSLSMIAVIIVLIVVLFSVGLKNYCYKSVENFLMTRTDVIINTLGGISQNGNTNYSDELEKMVENYSEKEIIELMAIDNSGKVYVTSSGFQVEDDLDMSDFIMAQNSREEIGVWIGKLATGERVMSLCALTPESGNSKFKAIKVMTSLTQVDRQLRLYIFAVCGIFVIVLLLMVLSGKYFIKSIVTPIRSISTVANKFAKGDFSERVEKKSDDEIGELITIINNMAEEISGSESMKNEFISSVSHELRTPLTAIQGWSETLEVVNDVETVKKGMRVITSETARLTQMVEELLDFSRIQNGKFTLSNNLMDVLAELGDAVLIYEEKAFKEKINVLYYEPEMLPFVMGDKNRIRQVFINVIDNAIKYTHEGGTVTIDAFEEDGKVVVAIADTGCGISEEDVPKVKNKFYKANNTVRGSGIGLAVAEEIVNMHGGTLDIVSVINVGTTVVIKLPAVAPQENDE